MSTPPSGKGGADVRDTTSVAESSDPRHHCPLACIPEHRTVLRQESGRAAATLCGLCGQAVTREQWLAAFGGIGR